MHKIDIKTQHSPGANPAEVEVVRVLHVDDDLSYRALCKRFLNKDPNVCYQIFGAESAASAFEMCRIDTYDCLILDYALPDSTGTELLSSLFSAFGNMLPPAVILTASGGEKAAAQAIRADAADFLSKKDVNPNSLRRTISNIVEKHRLLNDARIRSEELSVAYEELRLKNEEINKFYHTISHEVKTPLCAIREFISLLNDEAVGPVTSNQKELLGYAVESCDQIAAHFDDLIELARLETKKQTMRIELASPNELITRSVIGLEGVAREKNIKLVSRVFTELPDIYLDKNRVVQVISNLLTNAIKYTDSEGIIHVESAISSKDECIEIRVIDTGCGIDESHAARIFDRLYQINSDEDNPFNGGLGLGLSIAREIAVSHGGSLTVESKIGVGSTFILKLPLYSEKAKI